MPNLKDIKRRITSVKKTRQITSAMKLVAGAKLARATAAAHGAKPYQEQLAGVLGRKIRRRLAPGGGEGQQAGQGEGQERAPRHRRASGTSVATVRPWVLK